MRKREWIILLLLGVLCIVSAGLGDLARAHMPEDAAGYGLASIGFFVAAVLWGVVCAARILNEEREG